MNRQEPINLVLGNTLVDIPLNGFADFWQITLTPISGATGLVSFEVKTHEDGSWEPIIEDDVAKVVDITSDNLTFRLDGFFLSNIRVTPDTVVGTYNIYIQSAGQ